MPRGGHKSNSALTASLDDAKNELWNAWKRAANFQHKGIRGNEREEAVRNFLRHQLPKAYAVSTGEVVDFEDRRSTQLDVTIYDCIRNSPVLAREDQTLLPAESLLSVIEVKSQLTQEELDKCFKASKQLRLLRPYNKTFVSARRGGIPASDKQPRCFYSIFAYSSNLGTDDWLSKEWERVNRAAQANNCTSEVIDRILVLDRGLINPVFKVGKNAGSNGSDVLHNWFIELVNFLTRENARRIPVDWQSYASRTTSGWQRL
ncbi:MAG: DUF6602 domain-containing protein [Chloroflexia bacterium]